VPSPLVTTVGGSTSNSYLSLVEFAAWADDGPAAAVVAGASADDQQRALLQSTARLQLEPWAGMRATGAQALAWPRAYVPDPDRRVDYAEYGGRDPLGITPAIDSTIVPERVRIACAELAAEMLRAGPGVDLFARDDTRDYTRAKLDVLEVEYAAGRSKEDALSKFPRVARQIAPLLLQNSGTVTRG
jgi:hypothetical protein